MKALIPKYTWQLQNCENRIIDICFHRHSAGSSCYIDIYYNRRLLQGEWDTDIVREARIRKGKTLSDRNLPGRGDSEGWFVRHTERALRPKAGQGPDKADGNPVHLLRHPHSKRGAAGGQDRAESTACGLLKRKHAHGKALPRGNTPLS